MQNYQGSSSNGKQPAKVSPTKSPNKSRPTLRSRQTVQLCTCREYVEGSTFVQGERLDWALLDKKIRRVLPRITNALTPYDWGKEIVRQDSTGHTWELHHVEIKECLPAPSYVPLSMDVAPQVMLRGESASRMSDALRSIMNMLDQLPADWRPKVELPVRAEHLPAFKVKCSVCGRPRHDRGELPAIPEKQTSHQLRR